MLPSSHPQTQSTHCKCRSSQLLASQSIGGCTPSGDSPPSGCPSCFSGMRIPGPPPAWTPKPAGTVYARYLPGVAPMLMRSTWGAHRSTTVVPPSHHRPTTVETPGRGWCRAWRAARGPTQPDALGTLHPAGLWPLPEPSAHGALAPELESPRSQQPRMSTSFAPKGLHELALCARKEPTSAFDPSDGPC